jgi:hypothetical protein
MNDKTYMADVMQFLLPNGRQRPMTVELPAESKDDYTAMIESGCRFEAEILTIGEVSVTISDQTNDVDIDIRVIPNGPAVPAALVEMLRSGLYKNQPEAAKEEA